MSVKCHAMSLSRPALIINICVKSIFKSNYSNFLVKNLSNSAKMDENSIIELTKQLAPPLTNDKHKGQAGRIGVFGGSLEYTGEFNTVPLEGALVGFLFLAPIFELLYY